MKTIEQQNIPFIIYKRLKFEAGTAANSAAQKVSFTLPREQAFRAQYLSFQSSLEYPAFEFQIAWAARGKVFNRVPVEFSLLGQPGNRGSYSAALSTKTKAPFGVCPPAAAVSVSKQFDLFFDARDTIEVIVTVKEQLAAETYVDVALFGEKIEVRGE
jgi:hypothetical protein